jgi:hypothetical protein
MTVQSDYTQLVERFNKNAKFLAREISLSKYLELKRQYNAEDRGHLAKILAIRNIVLV